MAGSCRRNGSLIVVMMMVFIGCFSGISIAKPKLGETVIGIDLGTTYSCVGVYKNGRVEIIPNDQGNHITPSWVAFTDTERLIGEAAKNLAAVNPERTIFDVKRLMGREFEDKEVQKNMEFVPYKIVNKDGNPYIQVKTKDGKVKVFCPEEISAMILFKMKEIAEAFLGKTIKDAVIAVPAYFSTDQMHAIKDAGVIAGLNVVSTLPEPNAAAIAFGMYKGGTKNILVFDLGGGTFEVSILNINDGLLMVLSTNGDTHLGGEAFDQRIMEYFIKLIKKKHGKDISKDNRALGKLRRETERAKRTLSSQHQILVEIQSLFDGVSFSEPLTRARFEELNNDLFRKIMGHVEKAMKIAGLQKSQIDEILLVGGSTRIPKVQQLLRDYFDGKEPNKGVNPDEAVAYGAALRGGMLSGETEDIILFNADAVPFNLAKKMEKFFSIIPTKETPPNGAAVEVDANGTINVFMGEDKASGKSEKIPQTINLSLGRFLQEEIERMVREVKEFAEEDKLVKERIVALNRLETSLYNMKNQNGDQNEEDKIEVSVNEVLAWLSDNQTIEKEQIERMIREVEEFTEEAKKEKERWETYFYHMKNQIGNEDKKEKIEAAVKEALEWLDLEWLDDNQTAEKEDYDEKLKEVEAVCNAIITAVYLLVNKIEAVCNPNITAV